MRTKLWMGLPAGAAILSASAAVAQPTPICTDRPTKANAVCTVPAGAVQIELDAYNYARTDLGSVASTTALYGNPTVKLGLSDRSDLQVNWAPHVVAKVKTPLGETSQSGVGDVIVRYKHRLSANDAKVSFGLIPFVKIPTADLGIGNDEWEGGIAAPIQLGVGNGFTLTFGPEVDILSEADGRGRRINLVNLVNLSRTFGKLTVYGEFWTANDFAEEASLDQRSADFAVTYLLTPVLQIDAGVNVGLNDNTADYQAYAGLSFRF